MNKFLKTLGLILFTINFIYGQNSSIEINGGVNNSKIYTISSDDNYSNSFTSYNNVIFSLFYIKSINSKSYLKVGLEKTDYKSKVEINYRNGRSSYYHNVLYEMEYLNLHLSFKRNVFQIKQFVFSFNTSVFFGYLVKSYENGDGWNLKYIVEENPDGDDFSYFIRDNWEINTKRTENIDKYNFGLTGGFIIERKISDRISINTNMNYSLSILQTLIFANSPYNSLRNYNINIGISYKINNNKE